MTRRCNPRRHWRLFREQRHDGRSSMTRRPKLFESKMASRQRRTKGKMRLQARSSITEQVSLATKTSALYFDVSSSRMIIMEIGLQN